MTNTQTTELSPRDRAAAMRSLPKWIHRLETPTLGELALRLEAAEQQIDDLKREIATLRGDKI